MSRCYRVLVCGTRFGEVYLQALLEEPERFQLAGILARGSAHSLHLARRFDVPLYRDIREVKGSIDLACVALRSRAFGGVGSQVAAALLERGIHVLQEHPVTAGEMAVCLGKAEQNRVRYHVNSFYGHGKAAGTFVDYVQRWVSARPPHYASIATSSQFLFSSLDILGRALGSLGDIEISLPALWPERALSQARHNVEPFRCLLGSIGCLPLMVQLQSYLDPRDPDHHSLVQHRMVVGGPEGSAELCSSFGPVVWTGPLYLEGYADPAPKPLNQSEALMGADRPSTAMLAGSDGGNMAEIVRHTFPSMALFALNELVLALEQGPAAAPFQSRSYLLNLGGSWQLILRKASKLAEIALDPPPFAFPDPMTFQLSNLQDDPDHGQS